MAAKKTKVTKSPLLEFGWRENIVEGNKKDYHFLSTTSCAQISYPPHLSKQDAKKLIKWLDSLSRDLRGQLALLFEKEGESYDCKIFFEGTRHGQLVFYLDSWPGSDQYAEIKQIVEEASEKIHKVEYDN